jgi:hypothetical protein
MLGIVCVCEQVGNGAVALDPKDETRGVGTTTARMVNVS